MPLRKASFTFAADAMKWKLRLHRPVFLTFSLDGTSTSAGIELGTDTQVTQRMSE